VFAVFEVSFKGQQSELLTEYRQGLFYSELFSNEKPGKTLGNERKSIP